MKNSFVFILNLFALGSFILFGKAGIAQQKPSIGNESPAQKIKRMQWWTDARFGMFIHWGLYALPSRHEWVKNHEKITNEGYQKYFDEFNPDHFNPKKWAKEARAAGMKYAVLTTKHHEGFCLFDSKFTNYKATNTKAKRDLVKEYVDAFRAEGIKIGFYYSLLDWHHPDYTIDQHHPQSPKSQTDSAYARVNKGRNMDVYKKYLQNQVTELLSNYGKIDIFWLDFSSAGDTYGKSKKDWGSVDLLKMIRKLQPNIIVDNRLNLEEYEDGADFVTPEQVTPKELEAYKGKTWETCQTFSGSWGYYRDENSWKTHRELLDLLITSTSNGGNLILNVGPTARGEFDYRAHSALDSLAKWMYANNKSIYNCSFADQNFSTPEKDKLTFNKSTNRLYLHLFNYPLTGTLTLTGYKDKIKYAQFLHDNSEIQFKEEGNNIVLTLPEKKPGFEIPVVELFLK